MKKNLAIKSHKTRSEEVIEILEMLGGKNVHNLTGDETMAYYIIENKEIKGGFAIFGDEPYIFLTLEEFLEKFPYKVGDSVSSKYLKNYKIEKAEWESCNNRVIYKLQGMGWYSVEELQPHKEETMEDRPNLLQQLKEYFENTPREVVEKEWHEYDKYNEIGPSVEEYLEYVNNIRQPQYPKTYEECCDILYIETNRIIKYDDCLGYRDITQYDINLLTQLRCFRKLLICRDAYWKIAGEQMGLDKPWKPDFLNRTNEIRYFIFCTGIIIEKGQSLFTSNKVLIFPSEEMCNAFYENFKDLIELCKELF